MRTQEEIIERINYLKTLRWIDFFGYQKQDLMLFLEYDNALQFMPEDGIIPRDEWYMSAETPREIMLDYLSFAWEKANNKRGLSAGRSMDHYAAWLWLDGDDELYKTLEDYEFYGKPQLIEICKYLGVDPSKYDDGIRENE